MFDFLTNKLSSAFTRFVGKSHLTEKNIQETLEKVRDALLESDVPYAVVEAFMQEIKQEVIGKKVLKSLKPSEQFIGLVHKKLTAFLGGEALFSLKTPATVMVMGLQGSGKTTTIAKLAYKFVHENTIKNNKILCASVDFYRPAAIDQLEILAQKVGIDFYRAQHTDPCKAAQEIQQYANKHGYTVLLLDTAGRLHVDEAMLNELRTIEQLISPKHKLLVLDAMTGQESLRVAQSFEQRVGFEGAILTKIDSDTRAGAAFAFAYELKKSIIFIGVGEKVEDLELFVPERIAGRLIGMGDLETLMEKIDQSIAKDEQEEAERSFKEDRFTLDDFAKQMNMMNRIGSLNQVMRFIPGFNAKAIPQEHVQKIEKEFTMFKAIIGSMTPKERMNHKLLQASRKVRIAKGAGVQVRDVNYLLQKFEEMRQFAKLFKGMGNIPGMR